MTGRRTPRPAWLRELRDIVAVLRLEIKRWDCGTRVWVDPADHALLDNGYLRPRDSYEYPENNLTSMRPAVAWLRLMADRILGLADQIEAHADIVEEANRERGTNS